MKSGEKVTVKEKLGCMQMFYGKGEIPDEQMITVGSEGEIVSAWESGAGIVKIDNGPKVMVMDMNKYFEVEGD